MIESYFDYTPEMATADGYEVRWNGFFDLDGRPVVQYEYGWIDEDGDFDAQGFCYEFR